MAKLTINATSKNFTKKDAFNIIGAVTIDKVKGTHINVVGAALGTDVSYDSGEEVSTGYLKSADGTIYSTISPTAQQSIEQLIDMLDDVDGEPIEIAVQTRKSNAGRDFIVLTLV